jgi:hypothetical protein
MGEQAGVGVKKVWSLGIPDEFALGCWCGSQAVMGESGSGSTLGVECRSKGGGIVSRFEVLRGEGVR